MITSNTIFFEADSTFWKTGIFIRNNKQTNKIMVELFTAVVITGMIVLLVGIFKFRKFKGYVKLLNSGFGFEGEIFIYPFPFFSFNSYYKLSYSPAQKKLQSRYCNHLSGQRKNTFRG